MMKYIRTEYGEIFELKTTPSSLFVIRDKTKKDEECYVSYQWDNWKKSFLTTEQNCALFSYNAARNFISKVVLEGLNFNNLVVELHPDFKKYRQADTIEELCDEILYIKDGVISQYLTIDFKSKRDDEFCTLRNKLTANGIAEISKGISRYELQVGELKGAVWTSDGLIYVVEMNKDGNWKLL